MLNCTYDFFLFLEHKNKQTCVVVCGINDYFLASPYSFQITNEILFSQNPYLHNPYIDIALRRMSI